MFTTESGAPVDPRNLLRVVEVAAVKAGAAGVGVHTLRHSAAVGWLEAGVHIKAVADLLGHSSIAITGDVYGHTSDDTARAAVDTGGAGCSGSESPRTALTPVDRRSAPPGVPNLRLCCDLRRL